MPSITYESRFSFVEGGPSWLDILRAPANYTEISYTSSSYTIQGTAASGYPGYQITLTGAFTRPNDQTVPTGTVTGTIDLYDPDHVLLLHVEDLGNPTLPALRADPYAPFDTARITNAITMIAADGLFHGGDANDQITVGSGTYDLDGGAGTDAVAFSGLNAVTLDLSNTGAQSYGGGTITLRNIEIATGTAGSDTITGSANGDIIHGAGGSNVLDGGSGDDTLDVRDAGDPTGSSTLHGGDGNDNLMSSRNGSPSGPSSSDQLYGDAGDDVITFSSDTFQYKYANYGNSGYGGSGNDTLNDQIGGNHLFGDDGDDKFVFGDYFTRIQNPGTTVDGGAGNDMIVTGGDVFLNQDAPADSLGISARNVETVHVMGYGQVFGSSADETVIVSATGSGSRSSSIASFYGGSGNDMLVLEYSLFLPVSYRDDGVVRTLQVVNNTVTFSGVSTIVMSDRTIAIHGSDPLVDNLYYDFYNTDVYGAGVDPAAHYHEYGWTEGRNPNAFFSTQAYLDANGDVAAAKIDPLQHYDQYGWQEGRDASALFDTTLYLIHNPDVAAAKIDPLAHYLEYGRAEGRAAYAAIGTDIAADGFDREYYLLTNPDVAAAGVDPLQHYEQYGWTEGRDPNAFFDEKGFLAAYGDEVRASGLSALDYYDQVGWKKGLDPSKGFDTQAYEAHYADVAAAGVNPLVHYLEYGAYEQRSTFPDGIFAAG